MPKRKQAFRIPRTTGATNSGVDRNKNVIFGVAVATIGEAKGHGVFLDATTLSQIEEKGNAFKNGVKMRYGHPTMCAEKLGDYLGRAKNFRIDGDTVRADMHIDDTAFETPNGDLGSYILNMAEKNPDQFGLSIVFDPAYELEEPENPESRELVRVEKLYSVDAVDEPAANEGLFSREVMLSAEFSNQFKKFLNMHDSGKKALEFIKRFCALNDCPEFMDTLEKAWEDHYNKKPNKERVKQMPPKDLTPEEIALQKKQEEEKIALEKRQERENERIRINTIYQLGKKYSIKEDIVQGMIDDGVSLQDAAIKLAALGEQDRTPVVPGVGIIADERDKFKEGVEKAFYARCGSRASRKAQEENRTNEYRSMGLQDLARECLSRDGVPGVIRMNGAELYSNIISNARRNQNVPKGQFAAYPAQGTGDFVNVLSNLQNKVMADGYTEAPTTWRSWANVGSLKDFKQASINNLSAFSDVKEIKEGEAPEFGSFTDKKETAQLKTFGRMAGLSRQSMINDDMSAFIRVPRMMGDAINRKINKMVYGLLYNDNGKTGVSNFAGPTLNETSRSLFNTTDGTTPSAHAALSTTTLAAAFTAFASRKAPSGDDSRSADALLNIRPSFLLIGSGNEVTANEILNSQYLSNSSAQTGSLVDNIYGPGRKRNLTPIVDAEIDNLNATKTKPYYLVADSVQIGTLTVFFLNGVEVPMFDSEPSSIGEADGMKWYIRHDFIPAIEDWRGFYMNQGANAS